MVDLNVDNRMGTYIVAFGGISIPEEKKEAYISEAKTIAKQGGLFGSTYAMIFGCDIFMLTFPTFTGKCADFSYSYYEQSSWENAGIYTDDCMPYSEKVGWKHFNKAVQALYLLTEIYSDTMYISTNDSLPLPLDTLKWLRYVLKKNDLHLMWRKDLWALYEKIMSTDYAKDLSVYRFINEFEGDFIDCNAYVTMLSCSHSIKDTIKEADKEPDEAPPDDKISLHKIMKIVYDLAEKYKEDSQLDEEQQIDHLLEMLNLDSATRDRWQQIKDQESIVIFTSLLHPQITVKIFAVTQVRISL